MPSVVKLSVIMLLLSVVMPSVVKLSVIMLLLSVVMLIIVKQRVSTQNIILLSYVMLRDIMASLVS